LAIVAAADIPLSELQTIVSSVTYDGEGFGALLSYSTHEVLVWKNGTTTYDASSGSFRTIAQVDAELAEGRDFSTTSTFDYKDCNGTEWIVAAVPFFNTTNYQSAETRPAFIMMVFEKKVRSYYALSLIINLT
jgi:hypothetical protein